jgi:hypothetical protein
LFKDLIAMQHSTCVHIGCRMFAALSLTGSFVPSSRAQTRNSGPSEHGFVENRGQVIDQAGHRNAQVLFLWAGGKGLNVQARRNGYSLGMAYDITVSSLARTNSGKGAAEIVLCYDLRTAR